MAKYRAVCGLVGAWVASVCGGVLAQGAAPAASPAPATSAASAAPRSRPPAWIQVARTAGRLTVKDLGLVINTADPYSVAVGAYYAKMRKLSPEQVLRVELPVKPVLNAEEFSVLQEQVEAHFGPSTQALALAWNQPYAVNCNSITGALTLGYDASICDNSCAPTRASPYFNAISTQPFTDLKLRPSMLLAAKTVAMAQQLIQRGVAADHTLGLRGALPVRAYYVVTPDKARSSRAPLFPPAGLVASVGVDVRVESATVLENAERVVLYETGLTHVDKLDTVKWVPGAVADHLTSFGGVLDGSSGQMNVLEWIASGATASYGTVSEPCSHPQKFPHPQVLLLHYVQGATVLEAYWKSVAWPRQGLFIGEPLAAPFSRR